jgi:hypothetical protein
MKFTSALFLVLLLAQYTFAQSDAIEFLENSVEGKEILENILLQVSLSGEHLNEKSVSAILKNLEDYTRQARKDRFAYIKHIKTECRTDLRKATSAFHDLTTNALTANRELSTVRHTSRREQTFLARAEQELSNYKNFLRWVQANGKAWNTFYKNTREGMKAVVRMLDQINDHVKSLGRSESFIELPNTYVTSLSEISSKIEATYDNLGGMKAVIGNVLELIQKKEVISKASIREKVHSIIRHMTNRLEEFMSEQAEENESQTAMFDSLIILFKGAVATSDKVVIALKKQKTTVDKRLSWLKTAAKTAEGLAQSARSIVHQRGNECRWFVQKDLRSESSVKKFLSVIGHLKDVINDRWGSLSTFFSQKMELLKEN